VDAASSDQLEGRPVWAAVPGFPRGLGFVSHARALADTQSGQIAFLATPARTAAELTPTLLERGLRVIDLSGGHRLPAEQYPDWYGFEHPFPDALDEAVYGLPELLPAGALASARLVANPGCYATAAALAAAPLLKARLVRPGAPLVIDGKSGTTGAGKTLSEPMLFSEAADDVRPYRVGKHQHTPEIERALSRYAHAIVKVAFTPHVVPMRRGLLCSVYAPASDEAKPEDVVAAFDGVYAEAPGVEVRADAPPETKRTLHAPQAEVWGHLDPRTGTLSAFCALDNLVKGAAGQAIQNMNALIGEHLQAGLQPAPRSAT
jgi:N-acetyl-gamma-glutamyl-phosphate reductase